MKLNLGKVSITRAGKHSLNNKYDINTIVESENGNKFISKKEVPLGIKLSNTEYWEPFVGSYPYAIVDTMKDLVSMEPTELYDGAKVYVAGFHERGDGGGGWFHYRQDEPQANHNGGTIISISKDFPSDWDDDAQREDWFSDSSTENGCFIRILDSDYVTPKMFGAKGDGITDDTEAIQNALNKFDNVFVPYGGYNVTGLNIPSNTILAGSSRIATIKLTTTSGIILGSQGEQFNGGIKNLKILATKDGTTCLDTSISANNAIIENLYIESYPKTNQSNNTSIGIRIKSDATQNNGFWQNYNNIVIDGFYLALDISSNDIRIFGLNVLSCYKGIRFDAHYVNIYSSNFEFLGGSGSEVIDSDSTTLDNIHFFGIRCEGMSNLTIPQTATNCSIQDYKIIGTLIRNYSSSTLIREGNMFRDGITFSNRVEGVSDTTSTPSKLSVSYNANSANGLGENDGSFQFNRITQSDANSGIFGFFRYSGDVKTIGVLGIYRTAIGDPTNNITPKYVGEELLDTSNHVWYKAYGLSPSDWQPLSYGNRYFRTVAGDPTDYITPRYIGEEVLDTANKIWYKATGSTSSDWSSLN